MTTPCLLEDLRRDEGLRLQAYQDPAGIWTIGYGHAYVAAATVWTADQAEAQLVKDLSSIEAQLDRALPWWRDLNDPRQDGLANMAFNLGVAGLQEFRLMLHALQGGDWPHASSQALMSRWARDPPAGVGARATRIAALFRTGVRP